MTPVDGTSTATEPVHSDNFAKVQAQIHVIPCYKFNKKGNFAFSSLSTITGHLSPKRAQPSVLLEKLALAGEKNEGKT